MSVASKDTKVAELFTEGSHHRNLSVLSLQQNVFPDGKHGVTIRRNAHYYVLFKSPADKRQIMTLASQMYPHRSNVFMQTYDIATRKAHGYLLVDLKQSTPEEERLKTDIFQEGTGDKEQNKIPPPGRPDDNAPKIVYVKSGEGEDEDTEMQHEQQEDDTDGQDESAMINLGVWMANTDPDSEAPSGWKDRILFYWREKGLEGIQNPKALAYLANQLDLPCPYWYDCDDGCAGKARGYYVVQCPACKYIDFYVKQKGLTQMVQCKGWDDFIFETGWYKCLYFIDVCTSGKHIYICDHRNPKLKNRYPEVKISTENL
jgi:hypothetical protein